MRGRTGETVRNLWFEFSGKVYSNIHGYIPGIAKLPQSPLTVQLELTNACNMTCPHCSRQHHMDRHVGYMDFALFRSIVEEISTFSWCHLRIGGLGEPGLHPRIEEMLGLLRGRSLKVEIITNGTLLRTLTPGRLLDSGIHLIGVSIDGYDESTYKTHRPEGDYVDLRQRVTALSNEKRLKGTRSPEVRIRNVIFPYYTQQAISAFKAEWLPITDSVQFNTLNAGVNAEAQSPVACREIDSVVHIRWDGTVPLCGYQHWSAPEERIGDLHESSLRSLWVSDRLQALREAHRSGRLDEFGFCKRCFHTQMAYATHENAIKWNQHRNPFVSACRRVWKLIQQSRYA